LIPISIRSRLYVSLTDNDWKERIVSALEGRMPEIQRRKIKPFDVKVSKLTDGRFMIEARPRTDVWLPFFMGIPFDERDSVEPKISHGAPSQKSPPFSPLFGVMTKASNDGLLHTVTINQEATPTRSYYICCRKLPSYLMDNKQ